MTILLDAALEEYIILGTELAALRTTASLAFWIKTTAAGTADHWGSPCVAGFEEDGAVDDIFWGYILSTGVIGVGKGNTPFSSTTAINDDAWHHVLLTWDSVTGAIQICVDGVLETTGTSETGDVTNTFDGLGIRFHSLGIGSALYLAATLADVRVYDRILNEAEGATIHASNGHDGIVDGLVHRWTMDDDIDGAFALSVADRSNTPNDGATSGAPGAVFGVDQFAAGPNRIDLDGAEGDQTAVFVPGVTFTIAGATNPANDGVYTVASSTFAGGETRISVNENVSTNESGSAATATIADSRATHADSPLDFRRRAA